MAHGPHETGVWLVLGGPAGPPGTGSLVAPPKPNGGACRLEALSSRQCLTLASALSVGWSCDTAGLLAALRATAASGDPGRPLVAEWVAGLSRAAGHDAADCLEAATAFSPRMIVERLGQDLRFAASAGVKNAAEMASGGRTAGADPSGGLQSVEASLLLGVLGQLREHLQLREEFDTRLQEARLEALQQLAYGAGHEINNPLANIAARGQSLLRDEPDGERRRRLATIVDQAFRARDMIGGLMVFAKPPAAAFSRVNVGELVAAVIRSVAELPTPAGVRIEYRPLPEAAWAWADGDLVTEAVRAVVVNALQAVAEGGRVELAVEPGSQAESIAVVITDDGPGLEPEQIARVADPFFCGREAGRGLGIGLSKAWALTRASGGNVSLTSRPGHGTSVRIQLPTRAPSIAVADQSAGEIGVGEPP